jgi:hypothetical protein
MSSVFFISWCFPRHSMLNQKLQEQQTIKTTPQSQDQMFKYEDLGLLYLPVCLK